MSCHVVTGPPTLYVEMYQENLGIDFGLSRPLWPSPGYSTGKNRSNRCFSGRNLGTALGGKLKICAKLWCTLLSFFLGYQPLLGTKSRSALDFGELWRGCFSEQNQVPLWTLENFVGVTSWDKLAFCFGICRASKRLLLRTKSRSALDFGGESFGGKFTTASSLCSSNPWAWVESMTLSYNGKRLLFDLI